MSHRIPFLHTPQAITVFLDNVTHSFASDSYEYEKLSQLLYDNNTDQSELEDAIKEAVTLRSTAHERRWDHVKDMHPNLTVNEATDELFWDGAPIAESAAKRMIALLNDDHNIEPMIRFTEKLHLNPSNDMTKRLYDFIEAGNIPITADGDILVYKAIRQDWTDIHSGRFDNSIGKVVKVARNQVDEDPDRTCSYGLHVCSFEYLPFFSHSNGHVVVCRVNPADVVAIPRDYNDSKMRVCRYEIIGEVENWYKDRDNVLSISPFTDSWDNPNDNKYSDMGWDFADISPKEALPTQSDLAHPDRYVLMMQPVWAADDTTYGSFECRDVFEICDTFSEAMAKLQEVAEAGYEYRIIDRTKLPSDTQNDVVRSLEGYLTVGGIQTATMLCYRPE